MPAISPLMNQGTVTRWKKKEGESFRAGDVLLTVLNIRNRGLPHSMSAQSFLVY
ncbi:hypothetical protein L218DRAFT_956808 [Marasmius fiardii PR-910]|nr:hypothetical protein L218DRAFT_956808 [Marasmius fiardii PR-910]